MAAQRPPRKRSTTSFRPLVDELSGLVDELGLRTLDPPRSEPAAPPSRQSAPARPGRRTDRPLPAAAAAPALVRGGPRTGADEAHPRPDLPSAQAGANGDGQAAIAAQPLAPRPRPRARRREIAPTAVEVAAPAAPAAVPPPAPTAPEPATRAVGASRATRKHSAPARAESGSPPATAGAGSGPTVPSAAAPAAATRGRSGPTVPVAAASAVATRGRSGSPAASAGAAPAGDLEALLISAGSTLSLRWPAPSPALGQGETAWSIGAAARPLAAPIPAAAAAVSARRTLSGMTIAAALMVLVAIAVLLVRFDFLGRAHLATTGGPGRAETSPVVAVNDLHVAAATDEPGAATAPATDHLPAGAAIVLIDAKVTGATRDEVLDVQLTRLPTSADQVPTVVIEIYRSLAFSGAGRLDVALRPAAALPPGHYSVLILHGTRTVGSADLTVDPAPDGTPLPPASPAAPASANPTG